jgi:GTP pyrophosphokinase
MAMDINDLLRKARRYLPPDDVKRVAEAYEFSCAAHKGQLRDSGEDYVQHPLAVADILLDLEMDGTAVVSGLLHDVLEDTDISAEDLQRRFGNDVVVLVDGVTKLTKLAFRTRREQQIENLRKMFLAMADDLRVIIIKLADRLHNMRTLRHLPVDRQKRMAEETLEIYAPLANRLGIWRIKWELEDLCLRYLQPQEYYKLVEMVAKKRREREGLIEDLKKVLSEELGKARIRHEIQGRPKHFHSIYMKMKRQGKPFAEVYDLMAIRVIVPEVKDCYEVLGVVHTLWKPVPGRFKDFIAMPKSNMYQSLHTTVIGPLGEPFELQIRTTGMHRVAEYGVAAHWQYKESGQSAPTADDRIAWLRQLLEWQRETDDAQEYMDNLRIDLFDDEVFVFTPKGDVKNLPKGSTPVDFAYAVHSQVGHRCTGAKVNGRIVPLDHKLKNGDIVEILTSKTIGGPSRDWLAFVKTSKARNRIRQWVKEEQKEESILRGRELLERELRKRGMEIHEYLKDEKLKEVSERFGFVEPVDLLASIGYGKLSTQQVMTKLVPQEDQKAPPIAPMPASEEEHRARGAEGVLVKGQPNLAVRLSRCCSPVPGDDIVGYITRGRGVSIHRRDCPNVGFLAEEPDRAIPVEWDSAKTDGAYPVGLEIEAVDKPALLADIMIAIANSKTNISAVNARTHKGGSAVIDIVVNTRDVDHVSDIMRRINQIDGVVGVRRAVP